MESHGAVRWFGLPGQVWPVTGINYYVGLVLNSSELSCGLHKHQPSKIVSSKVTKMKPNESFKILTVDFSRI